MTDATNARERDYVLGTNDEELARLGLQHRVWRDTVLACWRDAGIGSGARVLDVGAGPGYATQDLATLVGSTGQVVALERSGRYVAAAREQLAARKLAHASVHEVDLMQDPIPGGEFDAAWCRWVACFVASPALLVRKIAAALRPGGVAIFHEYSNYATYRLIPRSAGHEEFVRLVKRSWRETGGEPDIARVLPELLAQAGLAIRSATPRMFCARPGEPMWEWPSTFVRANLNRLRELGHVDDAFAATLRADLAAAEANPHALFLTPLVLEIVAQR